MGWIDELRAVCGATNGADHLPAEDDLAVGAKEPKPVPVSHAIVAARLDRTHLAPDDILSGLTILDIDGEAEEYVEAIRAVLGARGKSEMHYDRGKYSGSTYVVDADQRYADVCRALHGGAAIILVVESGGYEKHECGNARNLASLRVVCDRSAIIEPETDPRIVAEVIRAVTGDIVDPSAIPSVDFRDIGLAIRHGNTGEEALVRLHLIAARHAAERDRSAIEDLLRVVNTESVKAKVAEAETSRGPRLSELSGFGAAREWGLRLAEDLRAYRKGSLDWDDLDRGIMLVGPPGTGKSFFARALAAECEVDLISIGYQSWAGDANRSGDSVAGNMNKAFKEWRRKAANGEPMLVFIDELDSFGKRGSNGHNESWFMTQINALLQFLDGSEPRTGIIVMGATNYIDRIDPALLRPGRLERTVEIPLPDLSEMQGIVRHHLGIDSREAAVAVRGRSPAQVAMDAREARRRARREKRKPTAADLRAVVAESRPDLPPEWIRTVAVHEAGHALHVMTWGGLKFVDIDAGVTRAKVDSEHVHKVEADVVTTLCGRAAEEIILGVAGTGCIDDLEKATAKAKLLETSFGVGESGLMVLSPEELRWNPVMSNAVRKRLDDAYEEARAFVRRSRGAIERVAAALAERRYMDGDEIAAIVRDVPIFRTSREEWGDPDDRPVGSRSACRPWRLAA
jgi:DNA replication protein DnaC